MTPEKTCSRCLESKPADLRHFSADNQTKVGLRSMCRVCASAMSREWYAKRVGRPVVERGLYGSGLRAAYAEPDRSRGKAKSRAFKTSGRGRELRSLRKPLEGLMRTGLKSRRKLAWLGCSPAELRSHLEAQFQPGMSWENRSEWHVDHIRPVCAFDPSDPADVLAVNHFTNLRPLWPAENIAAFRSWKA